MTKKDLLAELEEYPDNAVIEVRVAPDQPDYELKHVVDVTDVRHIHGSGSIWVTLGVY